MKSEQILSLVIVALVVGVVASFTTAYITGNAISAQADKIGKTPYTQKEIDSLLNSQKTSILAEMDKKIKTFNDLNIKNRLTVGNDIYLNDRFAWGGMATSIYPGAVFTNYDTIQGGLNEHSISTIQGHGLSIGTSHLANGTSTYSSSAYYSPEGIYLWQNNNNYFCGIGANDAWTCKELFYESLSESVSSQDNTRSCKVDSNNKLVCGKGNEPLADMAEIERQKSLALSQR